MPSDLTDQIVSDAATPAEAAIDGQSATKRPLTELIEADRYLRSASTAAAGSPFGLRLARTAPPGAA